jgi:acetyl-CoA acetyltransferase
VSSKVYIIGAGIHPFGRHAISGLEQGVIAARLALQDAGIGWRDIQFAFGGSWHAGNADAALRSLGPTGIPFVNVANGCATGGSTLLCALHAIRSGECDLGLVLGFDKHARGAFTELPADWDLPAWYGEAGFMLTTQYFAMKIQRYMALHGISARALALVAEKAYENGARAPHAWRREPIAVDAILASPMVSDPLTKFMFCSPSEGGAALVLASERMLRQLGARGIELRAVAVRSRVEGSFEVFSPAFSASPGFSATQLASRAAFEIAGVGPDEIDVAQIQDTECGAEVMHLAENGFCADGEQEQLIRSGATRLGGARPVNTDGGCLACGEPIGASGLRQVYENVMQLRGSAGARQVDKPRLGYSQVYGAPGVAAVTVLGI